MEMDGSQALLITEMPFFQAKMHSEQRGPLATGPHCQKNPLLEHPLPQGPPARRPHCQRAPLSEGLTAS